MAEFMYVCVFDYIMIASLTFVKTTFDRFNALCFEGKLPAVPIILTKAVSFLGKIEYKSRRDLRSVLPYHYDFRLKISTGVDLPQEELEDVVIHEMIHYYIAYNKISDTSPHGEVFHQIMEAINHKYCRHISVSHHTTPQQNLVRSESSQLKKHYICISTFSDGSRGITICASTKIFELYRQLPKHYHISKMEWYGSFDPFFNRFPRAITPKIYRITEQELTEHLRESTPLKCDGNAIWPITYSPL